MSDYQEAFNFKFTEKRNDNLTQDDLDAATAKWHKYVKKAKPLTQHIFHEMPQEEKRLYHSGGPSIFKPAGGLMLMSSGGSYKVFQGISSSLKHKAKHNALMSRKKWGWKGSDFLTDPNGNTRPTYDKGQMLQYGDYTRGDQYLVPGDADIPEPKAPKKYTL